MLPTYQLLRIKLILIAFASVVLFPHFLKAEEDDYEDDYEDEYYFEYKYNYCPSRYTFPITCERHFGNNIATKHTWMEAEDKDTINSFRKYLKFIPKLYIAECYHCNDCKGVKFDLYYDKDWPTEFDGFHLLNNCHTKSGRRNEYCEGRSDRCEGLCWNGAYFRLWNHKYIHFFRHFLKYCSENQACNCYWPELWPIPNKISGQVYDLLIELANEKYLTVDFSPYWKAKFIEFDYYGKIYTDEYYPNAHGIASSLTTYTFLYSQYHRLLYSIAEYIDSNEIRGNPKIIDKIFLTLDDIRTDFLILYNRCLRDHPHPKIYYERGMLQMHSGNNEDAMSDMSRFMNIAKSDKFKDNFKLTSEMYQQEGQIYAEVGMFDQALISLTKAIKLDPENRGAYFDRAQIYFENGLFDQSLNDFLTSQSSSDNHNIILKPSRDFKEAVLQGLAEGCKEALSEFGPSLCRSAYGLSTVLWNYTTDRVGFTTKFINACYDISNTLYEQVKGFEWDDLNDFSSEVDHFFSHFNRMSEIEKAEAIGYNIGKYGVDFFAGGVVFKGIAAFKKLREANRACNLEAMVVSKADKEALIAASLKHASKREEFFRNVKINIDKQNKHVFGAHNYQPGRSIFDHPDPQRLLDKFAGTGRPLGNRAPGYCGYREQVNFGEYIGYHVNDKTGFKTLTTWGDIHYSNTGAHIVPAYPK